MRAGKVCRLPLLIEGPDITDERGNSGDRGEQKMLGALAGKIEGKNPSGGFSQSELVADLESVKRGRDSPCGTNSIKNSRNFS